MVDGVHISKEQEDSVRETVRQWWQLIVDRYEKEGVVDAEAIAFTINVSTLVNLVSDQNTIEIPIEATSAIMDYMYGKAQKKSGRPKASLTKDIAKGLARRRYDILRARGYSSDGAMAQISEEFRVAFDTARDWVRKGPATFYGVRPNETGGKN
jgi:hypothetical protein